MKCLVLSFSNAKLHKKESGPRGDKKFTAFKVLDFDGKRNRTLSEWMDVPVGTLSHKHVANVLRVLANERPVSTFRKTLYSNSEVFEDLAKNAFVDMNPVAHGGIVTNKTGDAEYIYEMSSAKKDVSDSWDKGYRASIILNGTPMDMETVLPTWERLRLYLQDSYENFIVMCLNVLGKDSLSKPLLNVLELLNQNNSNQLVIDFLKSLTNCTPIKSIILNGTTAGQYMHTGGYGELNHWMVQTVSGTPIKVAKLKGMIYIPVTEEQAKLFENGPGVATILDGGLVCVEVLTDLSDSLIHGAKPVFVYEPNPNGV